MASDVSPLTVSSLLRAVDTKNHVTQIGRYRHSFLPNTYWGKPKELKPSVRPNFSFIRADLEHLSAPLSTKDDEKDSSNGRGAAGNSPATDGSQNRYGLPGRHQANIAKARKGIPTSHSLPTLKTNNDIDQRRVKGSLGSVSERKYVRESPTNLPALPSAWGHDDNSGERNTSKTRYHQRVTVHVPGQDGSAGHVTVQNLNPAGDVLPPLVSIHSSVSTSRPGVPGEGHFVYHHTGADQRPNLPHSDSNLSNASINLSQSPPFNILSVDRTSFPPDDSPVDPNFNRSLRRGHVKVKDSVTQVSKGKSRVVGYNHAKYQSLERTGVLVASDEDLHEPPAALSDSDYSSVSGSPGIGDPDTFSDSWEQESLGGVVDTMVQHSPVPPVTNKTPTITEVIQKFHPPPKPKVSRSTDSNINIHRRAYLAALSVARYHQMPKESAMLAGRLTRPFVFSYFRHIPHQKPCRCAECRERLITNAIIPRKGKDKKLSPLKAIFGNVKMEDYYPRRPIV